MELELVAANLDADTPSRAFYREVLGRLQAERIPFLVGGAYAFVQQTGVERQSKDFDIFVRPEDVRRTLDAATGAGYVAEIVASHWLAKIRSPQGFVDVIFSSGNGVARVDDEWFEHARTDDVLGIPAKICPPEEALWSKAFVMERERFDGADVAHIFLARAENLDWERLVRRFGDNWRVLLTHLILFGYIYPSERNRIPRAVMRDLLHRAEEEVATPAPRDKLCRGTLLSWKQYLMDVEFGGFHDGRLKPYGGMTAEQVAEWTALPK